MARYKEKLESTVNLYVKLSAQGYKETFKVELQVTSSNFAK